ncbi:MAG: hypothetical protein QOI94_514, partial [Acidobacteriaceae bacterium]|nr:hypothetical protein [Acidobacteriaceae bacterium]
MRKMADLALVQRTPAQAQLLL